MTPEVVYSPTEQDIKAIYNGLSEFNETEFADVEEQSLACLYRSESGELLGGVYGRLFYDCLHIKYLWLSEPLRKQGLGKELLHTIEQQAKRQGVRRFYLDTYTFQAPGFYEKYGYRETGRYSDFPKPGVDKVFYAKQP